MKTIIYTNVYFILNYSFRKLPKCNNEIINILLLRRYIVMFVALSIIITFCIRNNSFDSHTLVVHRITITNHIIHL